MKKLSITLFILFTVIFFANAIHPDKFITQLSKESNVETQIVEKDAIGEMMKQKEGPIIEGLESIRALSLEDSSEEIREQYRSMIHDLENIDGYETLLMLEDEEDTVRIMLKTENAIVHGMYVFVVDDEDIVVAQFLGNINRESIEALIEEQTKKN